MQIRIRSTESPLPDEVGQVSKDGTLVHDGAGHALRHLHVVALLVEIPGEGTIYDLFHVYQG